LVGVWCWLPTVAAAGLLVTRGPSSGIDRSRGPVAPVVSGGRSRAHTDPYARRIPAEARPIRRFAAGHQGQPARTCRPFTSHRGEAASGHSRKLGMSRAELGLPERTPAQRPHAPRPQDCHDYQWLSADRLVAVALLLRLSQLLIGRLEAVRLFLILIRGLAPPRFRSATPAPPDVSSSVKPPVRRS
jgi:hypothetical protein